MPRVGGRIGLESVRPPWHTSRMDNHAEVIRRAIEATEMGFWDAAIHRLLDAGWGVQLRPLRDSNLGTFHAEVTAATNGLTMPDDPECPAFGGGYSKGFQDALSNALQDLLKEVRA